MNSRVDHTTQKQIDEQAARWILRQEEGALSGAACRRFEAWLKLPGRAEALQRMQTFCEQLHQPWRRRRLSIRLAAYDELLLRRRDDFGLRLDDSIA